MTWTRPSSKHAGRARGAPPAGTGADANGRMEPNGSGQAHPGVARRIGAPPLIALASALGLLTLLFCARLVPGFVMPADADTTAPQAGGCATASGARGGWAPFALFVLTLAGRSIRAGR